MAGEGHVPEVGCGLELWICPRDSWGHPHQGISVGGYNLNEFAQALRCIADGSFDVAQLVTGHVALAEVASAFEALRDPEQHAKILVEPWRQPSTLTVA